VSLPPSGWNVSADYFNAEVGAKAFVPYSGSNENHTASNTTDDTLHSYRHENLTSYISRYILPFIHVIILSDCLAVSVPGHRSRDFGYDSRRYQISSDVVGLKWGPLSLVNII
jgi:hypothetical protein